MSTVEIIEEYRALWAQAQQEAQFAQALAGAILYTAQAKDELTLEPDDFRTVTEKYRMRVDQDGENIVVALEKIEDE